MSTVKHPLCLRSSSRQHDFTRPATAIRVVPPALSTKRPSVPRKDKRAADRIVALLADRGVEYVFGLPGGPIGPVNDALIDAPQIRSITVRHENGAMFAAAGYARTSGKLGVVTVTSGPGILNGITGLASAYCDGIPLLVLVGEVPRRLHGKHALQDGDHLGIRNILGSVTKWTAEVPDAGAAAPMVAKAIEIAMSGRRGPVALTLYCPSWNTTSSEPGKLARTGSPQ